MDSIFNEIFTHVLESEVAELVSLPEFIYFTQRDNPVSNTPEFMKVMLTLESVVKSSSHLVRASNIIEKRAAEDLEAQRKEMFGSESTESEEDKESYISKISSDLLDDGEDFICNIGSNPNLEMAKKKSCNSCASSRTQSVFFKDEWGQTIKERLNAVFVDYFIDSATTSLIASEMNKTFKLVDKGKRGNYVLFYSPLDCPYNVYYGTSCGSMFSFVKRTDYRFKQSLNKENALLSGENVDCAGYVIYGCSTVLTLAIRNGGLHQFTLDANLGMFIMTATNMRTPTKGKIYTINESLAPSWNSVVTQYIEKKKKEDRLDYYQTGSVVSTLHYIIKEGGIFIDPSTEEYRHGETQLLFAAIPMAFLMQECGGACYGGNGLQDVLQIYPQTLHETIPIFFGSKEEVEGLKELFSKSNWYFAKT
ncbi:fructose-1,6-bisphosphatase class 1 isoform X2 [Halyomorpha halys]|uniref:fructose-1,6-bisphosphatase class 1 isoform X2 n=1 Tax=Halyomorpha halys TaxID=286706 RepID=UPI0006D4EB4F|nr:uncharacterized protein LOC106692367 isoform X2 [Halyomorpha halys]